MLTAAGWFTLAVLVLAFVGLVRELIAPDIVLFCALVALWLGGVIDTSQALAGFSNPQVITIGLLFVIATAVRDSGALGWLTRALSAPSASTRLAMARLLIPTAALSAVMNNTPIVAMLAPIVRDWARARKHPPSRYLIPLSYAAIVGGTCTLIGTSTNLVVSGLLTDIGQPPLAMLELTAVGLPATAVALLYLLTLAPRLLPDRTAPDDPAPADDDTARRYSLRVRVTDDSPLIQQTVEAGGLRHLKGLFLAEILRRRRRIAPVKPTDRLAGGDILLLYGAADTVGDLLALPGLELIGNRQARDYTPQQPDDAAAPKDPTPSEDSPETDETGEAAETADPRIIREIVVSNTSRLRGRNLRASNFRRRYDAAVIAIHRDGARLPGKLGDVRLRAGDTLLITASRGFNRTWGDSRDFYIIHPAEPLSPASPDQPAQPRHRAVVSTLALVAMLALMVSGVLDTSLAVACAALALVLTRCVTLARARASIDLSVLVLIASSFGLAAAVRSSGLADAFAQTAHALLGGYGPWFALAVIYLLCATITEVLSNNAAAALVFPIAISTAQTLGVSPRPFAVAVAIAASMAFVTPMGYQTNLLVYGPGGYRFADFVRVGLPLSLIVAAIALAIIPLVWPF